MIRAEIKFKNATFMNALEQSPYKSIAELSRVSDINYHTLIDLAALKRIPKDINIQVTLAKLLNCDLYDLFGQYKEVVEKNKGSDSKIIANIPIEKMISLSSDDALLLESDYNTDDIIFNDSLKKDISIILKDLTEMERNVLTMYYGLNSDVAMTIKDISNEVGLSRERVRQIKNKAIRRIRFLGNNLNSYVGKKPKWKRKDIA